MKAYSTIEFLGGPWDGKETEIFDDVWTVAVPTDKGAYTEYRRQTWISAGHSNQYMVATDKPLAHYAKRLSEGFSMLIEE